MKHILLVLFSFFYPNLCALAQLGLGEVRDIRGNAVEGAAVVLLDGDSTVVNVLTTDSRGRFAVDGGSHASAVEVRHIAYETKRAGSLEEALASPIVLEDKSQGIGEVVVKASRPMVKVNDNGGIVYDAQQMTKNHPVANTMDLIEEIPWVVSEGDKLKVMGTLNTTIIMNGRRGILATEDLREMLEMIQPEQVKCIEVYYNAPAQFGVHGSVINIITNKGRNDRAKVSGSLHTALYHGRRYYQTGGAALNVLKKRWQLSFDYRLGFIDKINKVEITSLHHTSDGNTRLFEVASSKRFNAFANQAKASFNHDIGAKGKLSVEYMWRREPDHPKYSSSLLMDGAGYATSSGKNTLCKTLHTLSAGYDDGTTSLGADYLHYSRDRETPFDQQGGAHEVSLRSFATQRIGKADIYFNQNRRLWGGTLSYGVDASLTKTENSYESRWTGTTDYENEQDFNTQREYMLGAFIGMARSFGQKLRLTANMGLQRFCAKMKKDGKTTTMWNDLNLMPNLTLNYELTESRSLVFSFSTNRTYPQYVQLFSAKIFENTYFIDEGNPQLKPKTTCQANLNYILKRRYIFGLFAIWEPDRFIEQVYQQPDKMQAGGSLINLDYDRSFGITTTIPQQWNEYFSTKFMAALTDCRNKGTLYDLSFDREKVYGTFSLSNNFVFGKAKALALQITGVYRTAKIEGIHDLKPYFTTSAALTWSPRKSGWNIILKATDLLNTQCVEYRSHYKTQNYSYVNNRDSRYVTLTLRYVFNGYKQQKGRKVDTSRLGN